MLTFFSLLIAFTLGSLPFSAWIAKYHQEDLRNHGSGNIGATNVYRVLGWKAGILALALDVLKGTLAVTIARALNTDSGSVQALAGVMAVAGHVWSPFLGFRGGKGVATGLGVLIALAPTPALLCFGVWLGVVLLSGWVSLGSILGGAVLPFAVILDQASLGPRYTWTLIISVVLALLVVVRHRSNWERLMAGTEKPLWGPETPDPEADTTEEQPQ